MVHLKLTVKDMPSQPAPASPSVVKHARVTKPYNLAHNISHSKGMSLPPYRRLTIEDLLAPPPPPAVKPARVKTPYDIDMKADTARVDVLAQVCDLLRRYPHCEEEIIRHQQWLRIPEWKRMGWRDPYETEDDPDMLEDEGDIIRDFVKAASKERPTKRQRMDSDEKWEEPEGPTFSFPCPKPERKPKDSKSKPQGPVRARPRRLRENPKPSRQLIEQ